MQLSLVGFMSEESILTTSFLMRCTVETRIRGIDGSHRIISLNRKFRFIGEYENRHVKPSVWDPMFYYRSSFGVPRNQRGHAHREFTSVNYDNRTEAEEVAIALAVAEGFRKATPYTIVTDS